MREIYTYRVISEMTLSSLERKVNELLRYGWELVGGVSVDASGTEYLQALKIKIEEI